MDRHKMLLVGPTGCGKTKAMFDIIKRVLTTTEKHVWFMSFDDGYSRHVKRLSKDTTPEQFERLHVYDCPDWTSTRDSYREVKMAWGKGDWLFLDRVDLAWDDIQAYLSASKTEYNEDELDSYFLDKHLATIKAAVGGSADAEKALMAPNAEKDFNNNDWAYMKDALKSVVFDPCRGTDARMKGINVVASEFASYGINSFTRNEKQEQKKDSRRLYGLNMTIAGEKNVPGYFEATIAFEKENGNYCISSDKDRERKTFFRQPLEEGTGFWDTYQSLIDEELSV